MNDDLLYVWIYPQGQSIPVLCGALELLQGRRCVFSYDGSWLANPGAFALSPDMPLRAGIIEPPAGCDIHPVFEDAGPDRWGKNIINKIFNPRRRSPLDYLELAGEDRIGALGFSRAAHAYAAHTDQAFSAADLPDLMRAADALTNQMPIDEDLRRLLRPGSSAGGARPKAIIKHNGEDWLAKFPAEGDTVDACLVEHASLRLAKLCGIDVPESCVVRIGKNNVLLVKRFDREQHGRLHFASARTMLIAEGVDQAAMGYADIADLARRLSASPKQDAEQLFRRMALNVLIENTDDHEKNHAFLFQNGQWRLSPAYDIQPQLQGLGYQQLRVGVEGHVPALSNVLSECSHFLLKQDQAEAILEEMVQHVGQWQAVFAKAGVSQIDIDACASYVMRPIVFNFGQAPAQSASPVERASYIGKAIGIDDRYVYQSLGRGAHVKHDRASFSTLPLPGQTLDVRYKDGQCIMSERLEEPARSAERGR